MKGKIRKLLSVVVATAMTLSCLSVPAFADNEDGASTNSSSTKSHSYELYQVFTATAVGTGDQLKLSDFKWGQNGKVSADTTLNDDNSAKKVGDPVTSSIVLEIESYKNSTSDSEKLEEILKYVDLTTDPFKSGDDEQPTKLENGRDYEYTGLPAGYYLIKDEDESQDGNGGFYTLYVVESTDGTLVVSPKGNVPEVKKDVAKTSDGTASDSITAALGDSAYYTIEGSISSRIADFNTYYYKFVDTLSNGLTYNNDLKVYLRASSTADPANDIDITSYFYVNAQVANADAGSDGDHGTTTITAAIQDLKQLQNIASKNITLTSTSKIIVKYSAKVNRYAIVKDGNTNSVTLTYSNDPNNSGTPSTDEPTTNPTDEPETDNPVGGSVDSTADVYTTQISIIKKAKNGGYILTGAEFTLTSDDNALNIVAVTENTYTVATDEQTKDSSLVKYAKLKNPTSDTTYVAQADMDSDLTLYEQNGSTLYVKTTQTNLKTVKNDQTVVGTVNDQGVVTFFGLGTGSYTLAETKAPAGYATMTPITFDISFNTTMHQFSSDWGDMVNYTGSDTSNYDGILHLVVLDELSQTTLPSTGGIGTTIFYVAGTILVLGAAVALITRRRMKGEVK
jgi:fimbrial isopeptide formation D2 family protein/LPXTG-motif cell wall-anchored protein